MHINRRWMLSRGAATIAATTLPITAFASVHDEPIIWKGQALGAPAQIILYHDDRILADRLLRESLREAQRLENIFSLYRDGSELSRLNRNGALALPSPEFIELLKISQQCWTLSNGMFDPTIQPLWECLYKHFSQLSPDPGGPARADWEKALQKIGFQHLRFNPTRIAFGQSGMALSLNGIAQGFVTDKVVAILRNGGINHALVDMGEYRAIGTKPDGSPWKVGLAELETDREQIEHININDQALATSSFSGFRFEKTGHFNHLLNPKTGYSAQLYSRVTVVAPTAAEADAWATAFNLMEQPEIETIQRNLPGVLVNVKNKH
ncbi:FAD:protein FMN transferase [Brucella sp. 21LCYQ03]|nr:FAD:protein FMN transferase [Brucella sp. 21LCYQ03]